MSLKSREELEQIISEKSGKSIEEIRRLINEKLALYPIRPRAAASMVAGDLGIPLEARFTKGKIPSSRGREAVKVSIEEVLSDPHKYDKSTLRFEGYVTNPRVFEYGDKKEKEAISFGLVDPTGYISGVGWKSGPVSLFQGIKNGDTIAIDGAGVQFRDETPDIPQINVWASCVVEKFDTPKGWKTLKELEKIYLSKTLEQIFDGDEGIITVSALSIVDERPYGGCPICYSGIKKGELCKEHDVEPVDLYWLTLFVGDNSMESAIQLPPSATLKLQEMGYYGTEDLLGMNLVCSVWYNEERGIMLRDLLSVEEIGKKEVEKDRFKCPKCGEGFPSQESLNAHELIAHPEKVEKKKDVEVKTLKDFEEEEPTPFKRVFPDEVKEVIEHILKAKPQLTEEAVAKLIDVERSKAAGLLTLEACVRLIASNLGVLEVPEGVPPDEDIVAAIRKLVPDVELDVVLNWIEKEEHEHPDFSRVEAATSVLEKIRKEASEESAEATLAKPEVKISEKNYKLAKDLVGFLTPTSLENVIRELENTISADPMAVLGKMEAEGFVKVENGTVRRA